MKPREEEEEEDELWVVIETGLAGNPVLTSQCRSACVKKKKKKKPPDLHARCCDGNAVEQFSQLLFLKLPSYLLTHTLSLSASILSSSLGLHSSELRSHTGLLTHLGHEDKPSSKRKKSKHAVHIIRDSNRYIHCRKYNIYLQDEVECKYEEQVFQKCTDIK